MLVTAVAWIEEEARDIIERQCRMAGAMLPVLHALQERFGYIDTNAVPLVADALNLSQAEVHGVISFYHDFRRSPPGKHVLKLCRAEACQSMGGAGVIAHVEKRLGAKLGSTTANGRVSLEPVYCLGNCACAPAAMLDGKLKGRLSKERIDALLDNLEMGA